MLIKKKDSIKKQNSLNCIVWEYEIPSKLMSSATALIDGRYPEKGKVTNLKCEEIYYVISGEGTIYTNKGTFAIKEGDLYHFEMKEEYHVEGKKLFLFLLNAPPWTLEQHKQVK